MEENGVETENDRLPVRTFAVPGPQAMVLTSKFSVPDVWEPVRLLGAGGYAVVAAFWLAAVGELCAVKKIASVLDDPVLALRTLREIRLLSHFKHPNVLSLREVFVDGPSFQDVYLRLEIMDGDLGQLISTTKDGMTDYQVQCVVYQIMRGLLCLRMARVIHRDLKPGNILVRADGAVKIADFGLARGIDHTALTEYVVTRWYRAPEVVLAAARYTYAVDIWSLGCIFSEMLTRQPIFEGKDSLDQIKKIVSVLGMPCEEDLRWLPESSASRKFVQRCDQALMGEPLHQILQRLGANPVAVELISRMLRFDPSKRIPVEDSLQHRYLEFFGAQGDPEVAAARAVQPLDWAFDSEIRCGHDFRVDDTDTPPSPGQSYDPERFRSALFQARALVAASAASSSETKVFATPHCNAGIDSLKCATPSQGSHNTKNFRGQDHGSLLGTNIGPPSCAQQANPSVVSAMSAARVTAEDGLRTKNVVRGLACAKVPASARCSSSTSISVTASPMVTQVTSPALAYLRRCRSMSCTDLHANVHRSRFSPTVPQHSFARPASTMISPLPAARRTATNHGSVWNSSQRSTFCQSRTFDYPCVKAACTLPQRTCTASGSSELDGHESSQVSIPRLATLRRYRSVSCPSTRTNSVLISASSTASRQSCTDHSEPADGVSTSLSPRHSLEVTAASTSLAHVDPPSTVFSDRRLTSGPVGHKPACAAPHCSPLVLGSPSCTAGALRAGSSRCPSRRRRSMSCPKPCTNLLMSHASSLALRKNPVANLRPSSGDLRKFLTLLDEQNSAATSSAPSNLVAASRRGRRPRPRRESRTGPRGELCTNTRRTS